MNTSLAGVPPWSPRADGEPYSIHPRITRTDPFDQLLAMKADMFDSPFGQGAAEEGPGPAAPSGLGLGSETSSTGALLTLVLIQVLERLVDTHTSAPGQASQPASALATLPVAGRISQGFHPGHNGVDIAVPVGTPIPATMAGRVMHAGWNSEGYGNLVIVENGPYRTYYAHLNAIPVTAGQTVATGDVVGFSGNTGNSTGPHLHYELRVNGQPVDPGTYSDHEA